MHTNIKGPSGIARKCLLWLMVFILLSTTQAFASEPISYRNVQLTTEPARDKLSIRLTPQILGEWSEYYYTPDDAVQKELRLLLDELKTVTYTIDEKFWHEHPEAGYTIVDQAAQTEWMMLVGDMVLYTRYEVGKESAYMHRRYAECEKLTQYLSPIMADLLQYSFFDVTTLSALSSITLTLADGQTQTLTDPTVLTQIGYWLGNAGYMRAPSCPTGDAVLTVTTADGQTIDLVATVDVCPYFTINGIYYDYTPLEIRPTLKPGDIYPNSFLFDCFTEIDFKPINLHP